MPTTITSAGIVFNDTTTQTTAAGGAGSVGTTQIANDAVTAAKLGTNERNGLCKAFVNFGVTGVTRGTPYNVTSVTRTGIGLFTVNFATAMPNANYSVVVTAGGQATSNAISLIELSGSYDKLTTGSVKITFINTTPIAVDPMVACVVVFGN